jgi:hypothetical protein
LSVLVSDWSVTPASNLTVDGVSIAEACPPANINNALRSVMAGVRTFYDAQQTVNGTIAGFMPAAGGTFSGTQPVYVGEGAYLHNATNGFASGRVFYQAAGGSPPGGMQPGDWLIEY